MLHRAFTFIELIFVVVLVGIIAMYAVPRFEQDKLELANRTVLEGIRYTQHLAFSEHKFKPKEAENFKKRWQFSISSTAPFLFHIWNDKNKNGAKDAGEFAINPADNKDYTLDLTQLYSISSVTFSGGCTSGLAFDEIGRPYKSVGTVTGFEEVLNQACIITIINSDGNTSFQIEPETGYIFKL